MDAAGFRPCSRSGNSLLSSLLRSGHLADALLVFDILRRGGIATPHTYSLILKAVACADGCNAALDLFGVCESQVERKATVFDVVVYNTLISICGRARNWVEAEKLWRKLKNGCLRPTLLTYELLVSTFVQCGQSELVLEAYHELLRCRLDPTKDILTAVIASCTREGRWRLALGALKKLLAGGLQPNLVAFNSVINCLGKAGEVELAFSLFRTMNLSGLSPDAYTWRSLLSALYRSGRHTEALQLFRKIKMENEALVNVRLYDMALLACQGMGRWDRALQLLYEMETSGMHISPESYNHAIAACEVAREARVALQIYRRMVSRRCAPDKFTYLSLIRSCIWASLWNELEELMENTAPDSALYNALIHGYCLRGKFTSAKKLYVKMKHSSLSPDGRTRALMLQHLPRNDPDAS